MKQGRSPDQLGAVVTRLHDDFQSDRHFFATHSMPEYAVIDDIEGIADRARFITFTTAINFNVETAGTEGLWQQSKRLYDSQYRWVFDPAAVTDRDWTTLYNDAFRKVGWTGSAVGIWTDLAKTYETRFDGSVMPLIREHDGDAGRIRQYVLDNQEAFPSLRRRKVGPLWLRILYDGGIEIHNLAALPIPADRHIIRITNYLQGTDFERMSEDIDRVQSIWDEVCRDRSIPPVLADRPLWLVWKYWDDGGEAYLDEVLATLDQE